MLITPKNPIPPNQSITGSYQTDPSHPALSGHFPGHPLYPGVLILGFIMRSLSLALKREVVMQEIIQCKFLHPLLPGQTLHSIFEIEGDRVKFQAQNTETLKIASGTLVLSYKAEQET